MNFEPVLQLAAQYANRDARMPQFLPDIFFAPPNAKGLELGFDPDTVKNAIVAQHESEEDIYDQLTTIATSAVSKALTDFDDGAYLVALMVRNLREGEEPFGI